MAIDLSAALNGSGKKGKGKKEQQAIINVFDMAPVKLGFADYDRAIKDMVAQGEAHEVLDDPTMKGAVLLAGQAKSLGKKIEDQRKAIVDEPNRFVKTVNGFAKGFTEALDAIERGLKRKIGDYQYRQELARREAEKKAQEEARKLQEALNNEAKEKGVAPVQVLAPVMPEPEKVTRTEDGTSAFTKRVWTHRIVNPELVPHEYRIIDESKIRQAVRMGVRQIEGVEIFEESQINLRTA
jgi:hypothetical protein